jgi:hypothetical protein
VSDEEQTPERRSDDDRIRQIASEAATVATRETLKALGVDVENEREAQSDFQALRRLRNAQEKGTSAVIYSLLALITTGAAKVIWDAITKPGGG